MRSPGSRSRWSTPITRPATGPGRRDHPVPGDPIGFILEFENGFRVYAAGDTDLYGDMRYIRELYASELALLPIGGHYTMGPRGAAIAAELLGVQHIIPIHYGTFPNLTGTPDQLRSELASRGLSGVQVHSPEPGSTVS